MNKKKYKKIINNKIKQYYWGGNSMNLNSSTLSKNNTLLEIKLKLNELKLLLCNKMYSKSTEVVTSETYTDFEALMIEYYKSENNLKFAEEALIIASEIDIDRDLL